MESFPPSLPENGPPVEFILSAAQGRGSDTQGRRKDHAGAHAVRALSPNFPHFSHVEMLWDVTL